MARAEDFLTGVADFGEGLLSGYSALEPIRRDMQIKQELGLRRLDLKNKRKDEEEKNRIAMAKEKADFYTKLREEMRKEKEKKDKEFDKYQQDKQTKENESISRTTFLSSLRNSVETAGVPREKKLAALSYLSMNEGSDKKTGAIADAVHKILFTPDKQPSSGSGGKVNKMSVSQTAAAAKGVIDTDLQKAFPGLKDAKSTIATASANYDVNAPDSILARDSGDSGLPDRIRNAKQLINSADSSLGMARPLREATVADSINTMGLTGFMKNRGQGQMAPIGGAPAPAAPTGFVPGSEWDSASADTTGGGDPTESIIQELGQAMDSGEFTAADIEEAIAMAEADPKNANLKIDWEAVRAALRPAE